MSPTSINPGGTSTVTLTLQGETSVQSTPTDLVLVLDESGSISPTDFTTLKSFANDVVTEVANAGLFAQGGRVGVVSFASSQELIIGLSNNQIAVNTAITNNPQSGGTTCISCGLNEAASILPHAAGRNQVVIVITDGNANGGDPTSAAATALQSEAEVFAVGVGSGINQTTLNIIASAPDATHTFPVADFNSLAAILQALVAAVNVPGATNPQIVVTVANGWDYVSGTAAANLGAAVSGEALAGFTVKRANLGAELLTITYDVVHEGTPCGSLPVNESVAYTDDEGATVSFPAVNVYVNCAPVADAGPDVSVPEGSTVALDGTGSSDTEGPLAAYAWSGADAAVGSITDAGSAIATYNGLDDGVDTATLEVTDAGGLTDTDTATVTVTNVAPSLTLTTCPTDPNQIGTNVSFAGSFTDPGTADTHTMTVNWGDGTSTGPSAATSPVGGTHPYATAGIFDITVTVADDDGGSDSKTCAFVVVFDPNGGFVTGGGWINSPAGAYPADPGASGRANFGFVSKYQKGATVPTGSTEFQFQAGNLNFHSDAYQWLVVAADKAQYKGTGTVNGASGYGFMLTATNGSPDKFRIKIWKTADSTIVYDNQIGSGDTANPTTALAGGSIQIHKG
ncbi:vWA domain-containing protein [Humibacillus xanthopallidus]|uniref:vWA domain-containing protein n=1 Tax=Humibacillus xanthopallidus TaxID=412689 RepID=UPI00163A2ACD|nr:VWA domain-containing protein [Humibacillus xanthopallidus]